MSKFTVMGFVLIVINQERSIVVDSTVKLFAHCVAAVRKTRPSLGIIRKRAEK